MHTRAHLRKRDRSAKVKRALRDISGCYECGHDYAKHEHNGLLIECTDCPGHLCGFASEED